MFESFKNRRFSNDCLNRIAHFLIAANGADYGGELTTDFGSMVREQMVRGEVPRNLFAKYRVRGLSVDEAAVGALDGCASSIRRLMSASGSTAPLRRMAHGIENAIDYAMIKHPGRVIPRNGKFAERFEKSGMAEFFSDRTR